jgi:hypothetical protein
MHRAAKLSPTRFPFSYVPIQPLLAQVVTVGPLYATGDSTVPEPALVAAGNILRIMLQHRPDLVQTLRDHGAFIAVASRDQPICALPYFTAGPSAPYSAFHHIANGPQALKDYDPQTCALLDSIYQGSANLS